MSNTDSKQEALVPCPKCLDSLALTKWKDAEVSCGRCGFNAPFDVWQARATSPPDTPEPLTPESPDLLWVNPEGGFVANHRAGSGFLPYRRVVDGLVVAREGIRAAAEAVGEYLQAPPSMWDTIERLITQRLAATTSPPSETAVVGRLANAELRRAKQEAHAAFDPLWKSNGMKRKEAYAWLAKQLGVERIHIGECDIETCRRVVEVCAAEGEGEGNV